MKWDWMTHGAYHIFAMPKNRLQHILVYVTTSSQKEAGRISESLLSKKLIACANILPASMSLYRWKGKVKQAKESILLMKTTSEKFKEIEKYVSSIHSYECPCILQVQIHRGNSRFLRWIEETIHGKLRARRGGRVVDGDSLENC